MRAACEQQRIAGFESGCMNAYLNLLKKTLIRLPLDSQDLSALDAVRSMGQRFLKPIEQWASECQAGNSPELLIKPEVRAAGMDWPPEAESMIGLARMDNLMQCLLSVLDEGIPGDVAETGAWRGGASIFMRGVLHALSDNQRNVWVADSFQGLPKPDPARYPADNGDRHWTYPELSVSLATVQQNFEKYGLLDGQVQFLPGWFRDTMPSAPIRQLALLRIDGDMYESTITVLRALYPKVSKRGYVIVDDYGCLSPCRQAVEDYRAECGIGCPMQTIDWTGVYWRVN